MEKGKGIKQRKKIRRKRKEKRKDRIKEKKGKKKDKRKFPTARRCLLKTLGSLSFFSFVSFDIVFIIKKKVKPAFFEIISEIIFFKGFLLCAPARSSDVFSQEQLMTQS